MTYEAKYNIVAFDVTGRVIERTSVAWAIPQSVRTNRRAVRRALLMLATMPTGSYAEVVSDPVGYREIVMQPEGGDR